MKYLLAALLLSACAPAFADDIAFLDATGAVDAKTWYVSDGIVNGASWNACTWKAGNVTTNPHLGEVDLNISQNPANTCGCQSPTPYVCGEIQTKLFYSYGTYSARIKTAPNKGTNTAFFTYTGPGLGLPNWDEIDFEFLPKYGNNAVQLNWFKNGQSSPVNGKSIWGHIVYLPFDPSQDFHDYSFVWAPDGITWLVDNKVVWKTPVGAALPTHKQKIYIDLWASGPDFYAWMGHLIYTTPVTAQYRNVSFTPYVAPAPIAAPATAPASVAR